MIQMDIDVDAGTSARALAKGLDLQKSITRELVEWAEETVDGQLYGMRNYAPPPPNSTYVRTGKLGANWGLQRKSQTAVEFYNMTNYAGYVVGVEDGSGQAWMHEGRWWVARKKIEGQFDALETKIADGIEKDLQ